MLIDLSLNNQNIKDYLEGKSEQAPVTELLYIHTHPLIKPNFVSDIETIVNKAAELAVNKNIKGKPIQDLESAAIKLGTQLPLLTESNAPAVMESLRSVYQICTKLLESYGIK